MFADKIHVCSIALWVGVRLLSRVSVVLRWLSRFFSWFQVSLVVGILRLSPTLRGVLLKVDFQDRFMILLVQNLSRTFSRVFRKRANHFSVICVTSLSVMSLAFITTGVLSMKESHIIVCVENSILIGVVWPITRKHVKHILHNCIDDVSSQVKQVPVLSMVVFTVFSSSWSVGNWIAGWHGLRL